CGGRPRRPACEEALDPPLASVASARDSLGCASSRPQGVDMPAPSTQPAHASHAATGAAGAPVTPERIHQIGWGFAATQALAPAIEIDLFSQVAAGHRTADALAKATKST